MGTPETITLSRASITDAIEALESAGCVFWACQGPDAPLVSMQTCRVCAAIQELREVLTQGTDARYADKLEAADSQLCDCPREESTPISPLTREAMHHHCDCAAVIASQTIRNGESRTLHAKACGCDRYQFLSNEGV